MSAISHLSSDEIKLLQSYYQQVQCLSMANFGCISMPNASRMSAPVALLPLPLLPFWPMANSSPATNENVIKNSQESAIRQASALQSLASPLSLTTGSLTNTSTYFSNQLDLIQSNQLNSPRSMQSLSLPLIPASSPDQSEPPASVTPMPVAQPAQITQSAQIHRSLANTRPQDVRAMRRYSAQFWAKFSHMQYVHELVKCKWAKTNGPQGRDGRSSDEANRTLAKCQLCGFTSSGKFKADLVTAMVTHTYVHLPAKVFVYQCKVCQKYGSNRAHRVRLHIKKYHSEGAVNPSRSLLSTAVDDKRGEYDAELCVIAKKCYSTK